MAAFNKPAEYEKYYQILSKEVKFFPTLKEIFMLSAIIGFLNKVSLPFSKSGGDPIKEHIFEADDWNIINIIALETTNDLNILLNEKKEEKIKIIEEYAHAGIKYIVDNVFIGGETTSMNKFIEFISQYAPDIEAQNPVDISTMIGNIVDQVDNF